MERNPNLKQGDRVILLYMDGESLPPFTKGVVKDNGQSVQGVVQYKMEWEDVESGRNYSLISNVDKWVLESDFEEDLRNRRKRNLGETSYKRNIYKKTKL
jgi:hypothetical protein